MGAETNARRFVVLERLLFVAGIACLGWVTFVAAQTWHYQSLKSLAIAELRISEVPPTAREQVAPPAELPVGEPIGVLKVPRLHLSAVVANGDDDETLRLAIGHLPDTPLPWQEGNSALAGHRDTFFRMLKDIRVHDDLLVVTAYGEFLYQVTRTLVVAPDDLSVLAPTPQASLTLVTCYPFGYIGHAPSRFIVQAARVAQVLDSRVAQVLD